MDLRVSGRGSGRVSGVVRVSGLHGWVGEASRVGGRWPLLSRPRSQ